jgi:ribosomal subunit interface protein
MILARDIMTTKVITASPDEKATKIVSKMEKYDIKEVPIVRDNKVIGMVTFFDILELLKFSDKAKASNIMFMPPTATPDTPIEDLIHLMVKTSVEAIPIVENEKLVGIVSDYDILNELKNTKLLKGVKVKDLMRKVNSYLYPSDTIAKARRLMKVEKIDRLPVLDENNNIYGMLISIDMLRLLNKPRRKLRLGYRVGDLSKVLSLPIKNVARRDVPVINENTSIKETLNRLLLNGLKGTLVANSKGELVGMIYRLDILKKIYNEIAKEGVWIRISGDIHPEIKGEISRKIERKIRKYKRVLPTLQEIEVHIKRVHGKTQDHIYEVNMRLEGPGIKNQVKVSGYNILYAIDEAIDKLDSQITKKKKKFGK